ncbi:MAG: hypothetical protein JWQ11_3809, partial [Rhizobacter sp.]|nr:hypothetical protein [Rhizobacter sp.]
MIRAERPSIADVAPVGRAHQASIRSRLMLLVTAILLPVFAVALAGVLYIYKEERASVDGSMRETTRALALVVDREIARREAILQTLAASPDLDRGDLIAFFQLARSVAPSPEATIVLSDPNGEQLMNTRVNPGGSVPQRHVFTDQRARGNPDATVLSDLYVSAQSQEPSFAVQVPVRRDGRILYYLALANHASQLQPLFSDQRLPMRWVGSVVDREGKLVARSRDVERFIGRSASADMLAGLKAGADGFIESTTLDGMPTVSFFSRAPSSGWGVIIGVPRDEVVRSASRAVWVLSMVGLVLLGGGLLAAAWVGRSVVRPVRALAEGAAALGHGEAVRVVPSGMAETDQVGDALMTADRRIREANQLLEARIAAAVAASERAQLALLRNQKLEALGRLTGGIAHDFNNLLQVLSTGLYMLGRQHPEGKARATVDSCKRAVERGVKLTRQLMTFGRAQPGQAVVTDLGEQLSKMGELLLGALRTDIALQVMAPEGEFRAEIDPVQFELAILNLALNAKDATLGAGSVRIACSLQSVRAGEIDGLAAGRYVQVDVRDTGSGMTPAVLARAFEPFFTTKEMGQGSGLGLAQVYGFAHQHGGSAVVESEPGRGTLVRLWLPQAKVVPEQDMLAPPPSGDEPVAPALANEEQATAASTLFSVPSVSSRSPSSTAGGSLANGADGTRILVVEDDELVLEVVRTMLE